MTSTLERHHDHARGPSLGDSGARRWPRAGGEAARRVVAAVLVLLVAATLPETIARAGDGAKAERGTAETLRVRTPVSWKGRIAERCRALTPLIYKVSRAAGVDAGLVAALVRLESGFKADARSSAGARGLMQVMPSVWAKLHCDDPWEPEDNLKCGVRLLRGFLRHYDGNLIYALSAYASGYGRASDARDRRGLPTNLRYVERVLQTRAAFLRGACRGGR